MFRYTSTRPIRLYYPYTSGDKTPFSFHDINFIEQDGICCKEFKIRIYCSICDVSVYVPIQYSTYWRFIYKNDILQKINNSISLSHNHNNILEKLVRIKCDAAGKDFYIDGKNIASIDDRKCIGLNLSSDVLCGLCGASGISSQYETHPVNDVNIRCLTNLVAHYREHTELRKTESVDIVLAAEQIYNAATIIINELIASDLYKENKIPEHYQINALSKIIEVTRDCDCGFKKIVRCRLCDREFKEDNAGLTKRYKECVKYHFNKEKVKRSYLDLIYTGPVEKELNNNIYPWMRRKINQKETKILTDDDKICYCVICGQEYGTLHPNKDIVHNHFNACLEKHKGMAKRLGLQCC